LDDVARRAGVSRQTVSNAINAPQRLDARTLAKVEQCIGELGYRPNRAAKSLRTQNSHLIGFHVRPDEANNVSSVDDHFLHALVDQLRPHGYYVLVFCPAHPEDFASSAHELIVTSAVDGFVLSGTAFHDARVAVLQDHDVPFVTFGRTGLPDHAWVDVDGSAGIEAAVDHLVDRGHREIALLGWNKGLSMSGDDRRAGFLAAMQRHGLKPVGGLSVDEHYEHARTAVTRLLRSGRRRPTAIAVGRRAGTRRPESHPGSRP
jgi:DNA-binding LacI/PurR family transcriptional regulator